MCDKRDDFDMSLVRKTLREMCSEARKRLKGELPNVSTILISSSNASSSVVSASPKTNTPCKSKKTNISTPKAIATSDTATSVKASPAAPSTQQSDSTPSRPTSTRSSVRRVLPSSNTTKK